MLSEQTIKEGTILMLSLLNIPVMPNGNYQLPNHFPFHKSEPTDTGWIETELAEMQFHVNWNWLHAVIGEIHESYAEVHLMTGQVKIIDNGYNIIGYIGDMPPIEGAFLKITDYLKWLEEKEVPQPKTDIYISDDLPF